ncbi:MAG: hypothetical protein DRN05_05955 [Thermoplasmata archaeon]|nr:MAG: hypothetical protein DRN05_05955 [Thermoplasmata archaeon]
MAGRNERIWWRYILRDKGKIVYFGITSREFPESRIQQHADDGKRFTTVNIIKPRVTEAGARKWERDKIESYKRSHRGRPPRYNRI